MNQSECRKLKAKVSLLLEQNKELHRDNVKLSDHVEKLIKHQARDLRSKVSHIGECLDCATLLLDNEKLRSRTKKLETIINYRNKEVMIRPSQAFS